MDKQKAVNLTDVNMQRMTKMPEAYGAAIEEIMDHMDKDWQNRIVFGSYISDLCDVMEEGAAQGKSVEEIVGTDVIAYARAFQEKVDYRDVEATSLNKHINYLMGLDFLVFVGVTPLRVAIANVIDVKELVIMDYIFIVIGLLCLGICFFMKAKRYKKIKLPIWFLLVQIIGIIAVGFITSFGYEMVVISFVLCAGLDFIVGAKKATV